jgi:cobalamin biosynthesis protein CobT
MVIESESEASGKEDEEEEEESEEEEVSLASEEEEGEESDFEMSDVEEKEVEKLLASREVDGKLEFLVKYKVFFFSFFEIVSCQETVCSSLCRICRTFTSSGFHARGWRQIGRTEPVCRSG